MYCLQIAISCFLYIVQPLSYSGFDVSQVWGMTMKEYWYLEQQTSHGH